MMEATALGMIETIGLVSALEAADAGLKAAQVRLLGRDYVRGGLVMVRFSGDVAAVQAAVDAGAAAARRVGAVFSAHVIPRAMPEVVRMLVSDPSPGLSGGSGGGSPSRGGGEDGTREAALAAPEDQAPGMDVLSGWKVLALRQYARRLPGFPLRPSEIRYANKALLLESMKRYLEK